ncbi:DUF6326 family protein [Thermoproteota archaeon]
MDNVQIKLAAAWIATMFAYIYADILGFYIPGALEKIMTGELPIGSPISVFAAAILMSLPGFMVFLSVTLPKKANRWVNIIMGIFHFGLAIATFFASPLDVSELYYYYFAFIEIGFSALIIWYAKNWV